MGSHICAESSLGFSMGLSPSPKWWYLLASCLQPLTHNKCCLWLAICILPPEGSVQEQFSPVWCTIVQHEKHTNKYREIAVPKIKGVGTVVLKKYRACKHYTSIPTSFLGQCHSPVISQHNLRRISVQTGW